MGSHAFQLLWSPTLLLSPPRHTEHQLSPSVHIPPQNPPFYNCCFFFKNSAPLSYFILLCFILFFCSIILFYSAPLCILLFFEALVFSVYCLCKVIKSFEILSLITKVETIATQVLPGHRKLSDYYVNNVQ